jgi:hypothetical protein
MAKRKREKGMVGGEKKKLEGTLTKQPQMYGLGFKVRNPKQVRLSIERKRVDANLSNPVKGMFHRP